MRKDYDIVGSYNNQRVSSIDCERTVNLFEYNDPNGKRPKILLPSSGIEDTELNFLSETGGSRASFIFKDAIYKIFGASVFKMEGNTGNLVVSRIGTLSSSIGYVGAEANTFQVIFVDGRFGWIWDTNNNTFTKITDTSFPSKPIDVSFLDGFFIVINGETNNFQLSMINQGLVWGVASQEITANPVTDLLTVISTVNFQTGIPFTFSTTGTLPTGTPAINSSDTYYSIRISDTELRIATSYQNAINNIYIDILTAGTPVNTITSLGQLQQGSITSHPGNIVACKTLHRRLFLFSKNYTEVWENAGIGTNLPVRRTNGLLMEVGTPSIGSVVVGFDRMFFLSQDQDGLGSVMEVRGTEAIPVSNRALDFQLAQYASQSTTAGVSYISDARGILVKENGIIFYRLNFTLADHTFVLNVSMSTPEDPKWHEEELLNGSRHPAQTHAFYKGINYYGSYNEPKFYIVDTDHVTNDGEAIRRMRIGKPYTPEGYNRLRIDRFHLDLLQGKVDNIVDESYLITEDGDDLLTEDSELLLLEHQIAVDSDTAPVVFLTYSKDGGQTFGNYLQSTMGKLGERTHRTVWRKLGTIPRGQAFVPKIEFFNQVPFVVLGAAWDFEVLPE